MTQAEHLNNKINGLHTSKLSEKLWSTVSAPPTATAGIPSTPGPSAELMARAVVAAMQFSVRAAHS